MIGFYRRNLRLNRFAALGMALGLTGFAAAQSTQTRIYPETRDTAGQTRATVSIAVDAQGGAPASGTVVLKDDTQLLGGAVLGRDGRATVSVDLLPGSHTLRAYYAGDAAHRASSSEPAVVAAASSTTPDFTVATNPAAMTLTAGNTGTVSVSVTPVNSSGLTAPMFVTLACSGMPDQSSCTFTPENVEILPNATAAVPSSLVISTQAQGTRGALQHQGGDSVSWAILLPGALGLAGLAFSARRRRWLSRLALVALVGLVSTLGATACAARYDYYNHGPLYNQPTPPGTYNVTITAQSSNGVTAITHTSAFALTVK